MSRFSRPHFMAGKRAVDANASFQWGEPTANQASSSGGGDPEGCCLILVELPCSKYFRKLPLSPDSCCSTLTVSKFTLTYIQLHICTHVWTHACTHTQRALLGFKYKTILTTKIKPFLPDLSQVFFIADGKEYCYSSKFVFLSSMETEL